MDSAYFEGRGAVGVYAAFHAHTNTLTTLPHYHETFELAHIIEGEWKATVNGVAEKAVKDDFVMVLPNQIHSYECVVPTRHMGFKFSADSVPAFYDYVAGRQGAGAVFTCDAAALEFFRQSFFTDERLLWGNWSDASAEARPFEGLAPRERALRLFAVQSYLSLICFHYAQQADLEPCEDTKVDMIRRLLLYVGENFRDDITLLGASKVLGYSYHYLSRSFHQYIGMHFKQFVNQHRMGYAQKLIAEERMAIGEAALKSGFGTVRNFNRTCRILTGKTPGEIDSETPVSIKQ